MLKLGWSGPWPRYESVRQENAKTSQKWPFDELAPILGRQSSRRLCGLKLETIPLPGPREGHGSHAAADPNVHCVPLLSSQSMSVAVVDGSQAANRRTLSSDLWNATRKFLKVWLVLYVLMSVAVCFTGTSFFNSISSHKASDSSQQQTGPVQNRVTRLYRLYNRCSRKYVQMYAKEVNARGRQRSPLALLRIETDYYGSRLRIQSEKFGKYLCFNRKHRFTSRYNGKKQQCVFLEHISENFYTELESAWHRGLYLGFNRKGRFMAPSERERNPRCFQFIKEEDLNRVDEFRGMQYGPVLNRPKYKWRKSAKIQRRVVVANSTIKPNLFKFE
ncbi:hypothetical protein M514_07046 [Trichuris suis]|uniref:Fibroblast growth factor n=1 Tax=Trichuris suis TaxID=68888 RepID=A0A085N8S1_9BILA|nr:hypothetical protein M513_07046 [Trichuris suis]KFD65867.1 hypothetical protein M514_07046 [Trichuris suis]